MAKKILIFSHAYYPKHVGGAEVAVKEITDRISPNDVTFHMVTLSLAPNLARVEKIGNVLVHRVGFGNSHIWNKFWFQFAAAYRALVLHRMHGYDATWAMMAHSSGVPAAIFKLFHPSVPYVLTLQEGDPPEYIERRMLPLWPFFSRGFTSANGVTAISTFLGRWARRRGFKGTLSIVPNGVDAESFSGVPIAHDGVVLITTSRLVHKNAIDDVIKALPLLPENVRFLILGTGTDEAMLKNLARALRVEHRVEFVGYVDRVAMPAYMHNADIFIRASRSEGMGISFVEAMAAGIPVIATQEGGISDFLFDAKRNPDKPTTGWAVDRDSPEQIARAVKDILAHPEQVKKVVETARTLARKDYSWDTIARDMYRAFTVACQK
ncbi:MAG TPA: glycosyltransferase family 4 protein [Candidatus Paceibacterota bacterium]